VSKYGSPLSPVVTYGTGVGEAREALESGFEVLGVEPLGAGRVGVHGPGEGDEADSQQRGGEHRPSQRPDSGGLGAAGLPRSLSVPAGGRRICGHTDSFFDFRMVEPYAPAGFAAI